MESRRSLLAAIAAALIAVPTAGVGQVQSKVWRVGFLTSRSRPAALDTDYLSAWVPRLREFGYIQGANLTIDWRFGEGNSERLQAMAAELVRLGPDAVIAGGTPAALAMQRATSTIPVVIAGVADPVGFGMVESLARPGRNITGTAILATDLSIKGLEFLLAVVPNLKQVAVLLNPANPIAAVALKQIQAAAARAGIGVVPFEASSASQINAAFAAMAQTSVGALIVAPDPFITGQAGQIVELATRNRLPAMYSFRPFVEIGGLMYYGQNVYDNFARAATYVARIFKGANPPSFPSSSRLSSNSSSTGRALPPSA